MKLRVIRIKSIWTHLTWHVFVCFGCFSEGFVNCRMVPSISNRDRFGRILDLVYITLDSSVCYRSVP